MQPDSSMSIGIDFSQVQPGTAMPALQDRLHGGACQDVPSPDFDAEDVLQSCMLLTSPQANNAPTLAMSHAARADHLQGTGIGLAALQVLAALGQLILTQLQLLLHRPALGRLVLISLQQAGCGRLEGVLQSGASCN